MHPSKSVKKGLLLCGILSSLYYVGMNIYVPMQYEGYSWTDQTVSELFAIGAPTARLWKRLGLVYILLFVAFGWGVWQSAAGNRRLRISGGLMTAFGLSNFLCPPMHQRGAETSLSDTIHMIWGGFAILFMILAMAFGAAALGKKFRIYSIASIGFHFVFGLLTGLNAPKVAANQPTPWLGVWERINIAIFMLWVMVLAIILLQREKHTS